MALLGAVDDRHPEPLRVHGRDEGEEEALLGLPMALAAPGVRHVDLDLREVLDLLPHVGDGELGPLRHLHGGDLPAPEDVLGAAEDLLEEADRAVLLLGEEDLLWGEDDEEEEGSTYRFVDEEPVQGLLALELLPQLEGGLVVRLEDLVHWGSVAAPGLIKHDVLALF